jgi:tryptophan 2,3-dioxygenase
MHRHHDADLPEVYRSPQKYPELYALADALSVLDQTVTLWRYAHIQLVERTIGASTVGTGGTTHDYLQRAAGIKLFPEIWEARNELARRVDEEAGK